MKKLIAILLMLACLPMTCLEGHAGHAEPEKQSAVGFYLDTVVTLTAYDVEAQVLQDALKVCGAYENLLSRTIEGSDVWNINHAEGAPVEVSADTLAILDCAVQVNALSLLKLRF